MIRFIKFLIFNRTTLNLRLFVKKFFFPVYFTAKPLANKKRYLSLYDKLLKKKLYYKKYIKNNLKTLDIVFIKKLALSTVVTIKKTPLNYEHGFLLAIKLIKYIKKNKLKKINILETGTARGYSSIIMSYVLNKYKIKGKITTVDIIPNNIQIFWNCIADTDNIKKNRKTLLVNYNQYLKKINFENNNSEIFLKTLKKRLNFVFLDGAHDYETVKNEYNFIRKLQKKNDVLFFDDVTESQFPGIFRLISEIKQTNQYKVKLLNLNSNRGYAELIKN